MMNILLVEDDRSLAEVILDSLIAWGNEPEWSVTGADALERVKQRNFDLILMDTFLPDIQAYELIPQFKKIQPEAGIVTMTNSNSRELELQVRRQGIIYYMVKPFSLKIIQEILQHLTATRYNGKNVRSQG